MRTNLIPLLALPLLTSLPAHASPESDRIAELEARLAALESHLLQPAPLSGRANAAARLALLSARVPVLGAFTAPMFGARISGGGLAGVSSDGTNLTVGSGSTGTVIAENPSGVTVSGTQSLLGSSPSGAGVGFTRGGGGELILWSNSGVTAATIVASQVLLPATSEIAITPNTLTIADSGGVGAATHTAVPAGGRVRVTCNDADTCEWTITETGATSGECHTIINAGTNSLVMKHAAGQVLFPSAGDQTLGQNDEVEVCYDSTLSAWLGTAAVNR